MEHLRKTLDRAFPSRFPLRKQELRSSTREVSYFHRAKEGVGHLELGDALKVAALRILLSLCVVVEASWACRWSVGSRPSNIRTRSRAGVFNVVGMPRLNITDLILGSLFSVTFCGNGISIRMVASRSIRLTPFP